jgi:arylsulfatase A-like enzyme
MFLRSALAATALTPLACAPNLGFTRKRHRGPNVIIIMTDDQGYGDLSCHGNPVLETPNLDKLHGESIRFTNFHVDPTCSPTRGALMTGRYSHRARVWHTINGGNYLRSSEVTMADIFKASGYKTAMFGKWHLGGNYPYRPMDRGFDEWLGQGDGGTGTTADYFTNDRVNDMYLHNGRWTHRKGWAPDVFFKAATDFIESIDPNTPFFIYLNTYVPHSPHTIPDKSWLDKYQGKVPLPAATFFASIEHIDNNIGKLRQCLSGNGLADNTILIFLTDNGGTAGVEIFNAFMRGKKGSPYDGGHRVPFFIHYPAGNIKHGRDVSDLTAHFDVLPTLVDLCRLSISADTDFDGRSFARQLRSSETVLPPRTLIVERQRTILPIKWDAAAAMTNRWRLVDNRELYNIIADPSQKANVIDQYPKVATALRRDFDRYWARVSPGDRDRPSPIVGSRQDEETYLHPADWYVQGTPWNHAHIAAGPAKQGSWLVTMAHTGRYRLEISRWPREADTPITSVPNLGKTIDAFNRDQPVTDLIYGSGYRPLPVRTIKIEIADFEAVAAVNDTDRFVEFEVPLKQGPHELKATMLDKQGQPIASAYYIYITGQP